MLQRHYYSDSFADVSVFMVILLRVALYPHQDILDKLWERSLNMDCTCDGRLAARASNYARSTQP